MTKAKAKGTRHELETLKKIQAQGIKAYKVPRSGAGVISDDLVIGSAKVARATDLRIECKRRANLPDWVTEFLASSELCAMREDKGKRIWLMTDDMFFRLVKAYERERHLSTADDCDRMKLLLFTLINERKEQLKAQAKQDEITPVPD